MIITVTAAHCIDNGRILLCRRAPGEKLSGFWEFPGGKVEDGESYASCLARELREELGIVCKIGEEVARNTHHYDGFSIELVLLDTRIESGSIKLAVHDKYEWVPVETLLEWNLAPADIPLAEKVIELHSGSYENE